MKRTKQHQLTRIVRGWLKETYPNLKRNVIISEYEFDQIWLEGHDIVYAHPDFLEVPSVSKTTKLYPSNPKFFTRLKSLVTRRLNHRSRCTDMTVGHRACFHF